MYKYVFYKLYRWSQAVNGESRLHEINAAIMLSLTVGMYLLALEAGLQLFGISPRKVSEHPEIDGAFFAVIFSAIVFGFNFYILKYRIGFDKIIKKFESEDSIKEKAGNILVTLYVLGSMVLPISLWLWIAARNSL